MGLSRNKVAVPEGAAGTPPFWRLLDGIQDVKKKERKAGTDVKDLKDPKDLKSRV